MINEKLFVILFLIIAPLNASEYCQICPNHTLCKYPTPGPSQSCAGYDTTALLNREDIVDIVNRINERRNYVALGLSKKIPQAANMRKISWSEYLAWSAQRWVDQCDPHVRPDRQDQCRDLAFVPVGQNIATIFGPSPGLSTRSFIDMWYMQIMDYDGNISLYNASRDGKTNYFTQLIWAEVDSVGCGKARFYINLSTSVERLVCNFAPRGNIHGKPVYAIGLPATQCPASFQTDGKYPGLCTLCTLCTHKTLREDQTSMPDIFPSTSVLRILNLSNSSKDIDPINHNLKQVKLPQNRQQKSRHVVNNSFDNDKPRFLPQHMQWHNHNYSAMFPLNQHYHPTTRAYHGHEHEQNFPQPLTGYNKGPDVAHFPVIKEDFRRLNRFEMITQPQTYAPGIPPDPDVNNNIRKNFAIPINGAVNYKVNPCRHCTRGYPLPIIYNQPQPVPHGANPCVLPSVGCGIRPPYFSGVFPPPHVVPHSGCPCNLQLPPPYPISPVPVPPPIPDRLCCNYPPPCFSQFREPCGPVFPSHCCQNDQQQMSPQKEIRRSESDFHYYDLFPNVVMRSGDSSSERSQLERNNNSVGKKIWLSGNPVSKKQVNLYRIKELDRNHEKEKNELEYPRYSEHEHDYSYDSVNRQKRQNKSPWQIDDVIMNSKTLRFTTLPYGIRRVKSTSVKQRAETESITISQQSFESEDIQPTEKYLSFNDLMHLRKNTAENIGVRRMGNLRQGKKPATAPAKPAPAPTKPAPAPAKSAPAPVKPAPAPAKRPAKPAPAPAKRPAKPAPAPAKRPAKPTHAPARRAPDETSPEEGDGDNNPNPEETETTSSTHPPNYTTATPFKRKKFCTRRLTCTWTSLTNPDGGKVKPSGGRVIGSKTPPGYVEGCTRTSTCTREHLNRNKISTLSNTKYPGQVEDEEDEDYCERKSLDVRKRNLNGDQEIYSRSNTKINSLGSTVFPILKRVTGDNCDCTVQQVKRKRDVNNFDSHTIPNNEHSRSGNHETETSCHNPLMSYGDLYYLVISKIMKRWQENKAFHSKKCVCNSSTNNDILYYFPLPCVIFTIVLLSFNNLYLL